MKIWWSERLNQLEPLNGGARLNEGGANSSWNPRRPQARTRSTCFDRPTFVTRRLSEKNGRRLLTGIA